jgi:hypothetical protein
MSFSKFSRTPPRSRTPSSSSSEKIKFVQFASDGERPLEKSEQSGEKLPKIVPKPKKREKVASSPTEHPRLTRSRQGLTRTKRVTANLGKLKNAEMQTSKPIISDRIKKPVLGFSFNSPARREKRDFLINSAAFFFDYHLGIKIPLFERNA